MASSILPAVFDTAPWIELLASHTAKRDMFSAKSLMTIIEGLDAINQAQSVPGGSPLVVTAFHASLFERLQASFNNPALLKAVGMIYLGDYRLPGMALKHFDLAHQFAPKDREIEQLQRTAALTLAQVANAPSHSGIDEAPHARPAVSDLIRKTTRLGRIEPRVDLGVTAGEMERKQAMRKTKMILPAREEPVPTIDCGPLFERAHQAIMRTDFAVAAEALAAAGQAHGDVGELQALYAQLGLAAYDNDRLDEALQAYFKMRDLGPGAVEGWFNCGLVLQKMGRLDEAVASYREGVRLAPDNSKTWCNLSSLLFDRGEVQEAEACARQALVHRPDYARAWDNLAAVLGATQRYQEAAEACHQAIKSQPDLHSAWFKLGVVNFQQDNLTAAQEALTLTGDNPDYFGYVLYYLSMIEARRGHLDPALQKLAQARAADPENELECSALKELGTACAKLGRDSTAAEFYGQAVARRPDDFAAWLARGTCLHRIEQLAPAREAYMQASFLMPDNPMVWHNLGLLASDQGNHEESRECFEREVALAPGDPKAWYDLAVCLQALGLEDEGQAAYERAEGLVRSSSRRSSDLSAALSIVRRLNLGDRVLKTV